MTFEELKEKYSDVDIAKEHDNIIMIGEFSFWKSGEIKMIRIGCNLEGCYFNIDLTLAKDRTPEQMDKFAEALSL